MRKPKRQVRGHSRLQSDVSTPPPGRKPLLRRPAVWLGGVAVGAAATVITSVLVGIPAQLIDVPAAQDKLRPDPDLRIISEIVYLNDEGRPKVVPGDYQPPEDLRQMMSVPEGVVDERVHLRLLDAGAAFLHKLTVRLILEGRRSQGIRILGIRPVILQRTEPLDGTLFGFWSQGEEPALDMIADVDEHNPIAREMNAEYQPAAPYFERHTIWLADRKQQTVVFRTMTSRHYVVFRLQIDYLLGTQRKRQLIGNGGRPFRITGLHCAGRKGFVSYKHAYTFDGSFRLVPLTGKLAADRMGVPSPC
ncbi:MAG TPA: hypothetical protein VFU43_18955 [Streptosporangiaceae bacterium]|nr:hypothetical protein [Streptosporangiaceae bacterium]